MIPPTTEFHRQRATVHNVAAQYWERNLSDLVETLNAIEVIKYNPGKMMGFFPQFDQFPPVFFKVYFNNAFVYEMQGLEAAHAMPEVPGVRTPTIVRVFPEHKAILTAKRGWEDTTTPIKRFFVGSLGIDWVKVGRWLRAFHDTQISQTPNEKFIRRKFAKIESHKSDLRELFTPDQMDIMQKIVGQARDFFESNPIEWVLSHGDFGLDNIKNSDGVMEIIDFEDCQMAPRAFDTLNFLTRLEYVGYFPHLPGTYRKIRKDFWVGYDMPIILKSPVFDFFYLLIKLDAIETYYRRRYTDTNKIVQKMIYYCFENKGLNQLKGWLTQIA